MADHQHTHTGAGPDATGFWPGEYTFCPWCGAHLEPRLVGGSERMACHRCEFVHYRNPGVGAAVVLFDEEGRLLLVKRGPEVTQSGKWSIPAGYVNYGEDIRAAAARELLEETGLIAEIGPPLFVASNFHDPTKLTVGIWFQGEVVGGSLQAGDDAVDVGWFALDDLPDMAFETDLAYLAGL